MPDTKENFDLREEIAKRRKSLGMTQAHLATASGIPRENICAYERGKADMNGQSLQRIIAALGGEIRWRETERREK